MSSPGAVCQAFAGTKVRYCVLLRIRPDGAFVLIWGTGTDRALPRVEVKAGTAAYASMRLEKTTYFYQNNIVVLLPAAVKATGASCPPSVFADLRRLVGL